MVDSSLTTADGKSATATEGGVSTSDADGGLVTALTIGTIVSVLVLLLILVGAIVGFLLYLQRVRGGVRVNPTSLKSVVPFSSASDADTSGQPTTDALDTSTHGAGQPPLPTGRDADGGARVRPEPPSPSELRVTAAADQGQLLSQQRLPRAHARAKATLTL